MNRESVAPFFVVGAPRSGTTLLRLMLDQHPRLALPRESHFVVALAARRLRLAHRPEAALAAIRAFPRYSWLGLDDEVVDEIVARRHPRTFAQVVRCVFDAYAHSRGKPRWGDKTPGYVLHLPLLASLFPDAQFVHVVRDGRAVARSIAERPWGLRSPCTLALWWSRVVRTGRREGRALGESRYLELRLEDLIAGPEVELERVCDFLGERFSPSMLEYQDAAADYLALSPSLAEVHPHLLKPPTAGLRRWEEGLSEREAAAIEAGARRGLVAFGYPVGRVEIAATLRAWRGWISEAPTRAVKGVIDRSRPSRRSI